MESTSYLRQILAALGALFVMGCSVGPDFVAPELPDKAGVTAEPTLAPTSSADRPAGAQQRFDIGRDIPADWWTLFHSPELDSLVRRAIAANPDLAAAKAALRQAREVSLAQGGAYYPTVQGQLNDMRSQVSGAAEGVPQIPTELFSLANAQVAVTYPIDIFGGVRRAVEASEADERVAKFQLEAAYLSLTANVVTAAVQDASLRGQIAATREIIEDQARQLDVVERQFTLGGVSRADVLAQQATLAQTRATLPPLEKQLAQLRNQLTALSGAFPSQEIEEKFSLASLQLPTDLPVSLPSALARQRPDIRAAEEQLHAANAEVGVARANQFPQISLTASFGAQSAGLTQLFDHSQEVWSVGGGLVQPLFDGRSLEHKHKAAEAARDQTEAVYRSTVLAAFRNVADALRALDADADALKAQAAAERSAADSLALTRDQFALGAVSYLTLLNAERTYQQARIALIQAEAARLADTAALFQSLGGGWWNRAPDAVVEE
jgi:NodT family efflux transporter outer membrane factor (OMF) lipoprotein